MSQKEKSQLWKRKLTGLHSLPMPHHFLSTFLKMWGNLEQRSPSLLFPNLIPLLAERNKKKIQKRSWRRKEKREKIVETIRTELVFVRGVTQEAKRAASLLFFFFSPPFLAHPDTAISREAGQRKGHNEEQFQSCAGYGRARYEGWIPGTLGSLSAGSS